MERFVSRGLLERGGLGHDADLFMLSEQASQAQTSEGLLGDDQNPSQTGSVFQGIGHASTGLANGQPSFTNQLTARLETARANPGPITM